MKRLLFALLLTIGVLGFTYEADAQNATRVTVDTLANTDTVDVVIKATAGYNSLAIQPICTKVSGTVSAHVIIYASLDGSNYVALGDTLTVENSNGAQTALFSYQDPEFTHYKVRFISSGTMAVANRLYYVLKRHN